MGGRLCPVYRADPVRRNGEREVAACTLTAVTTTPNCRGHASIPTPITSDCIRERTETGKGAGCCVVQSVLGEADGERQCQLDEHRCARGVGGNARSVLRVGDGAPHTDSVPRPARVGRVDPGPDAAKLVR
jgi:hypothetical protein